MVVTSTVAEDTPQKYAQYIRRGNYYSQRRRAHNDACLSKRSTSGPTLSRVLRGNATNFKSDPATVWPCQYTRGSKRGAGPVDA
eukprot:281802-Amphidinium_carterae.1